MYFLALITSIVATERTQERPDSRSADSDILDKRASLLPGREPMFSERRPKNMAELFAVVSKSCLIPDDRLSAALQYFGCADNGAQSIHGFARYLVEEELLTEWQCEKLLAGRFKGFIHGNLVIQRQLRKDYRHSYYEAIDSANGDRVVLRASPQDDGQITFRVVNE